MPAGQRFSAGIRRVIAIWISRDFHQGIGEPFWLVEHHDVVGVCFESIPRWVSLALSQRLVESGIGKFGGADVSLFLHPVARTGERDRLRIRPYRLRRQLRVDVVSILLIDENRRQLRWRDRKA